MGSVPLPTFALALPFTIFIDPLEMAIVHVRQLYEGTVLGGVAFRIIPE